MSLQDDIYNLKHRTAGRYGYFIDGLTSKQYQAWMRSKTVPKALKHQIRYNNWVESKNALEALLKRSAFHIIQGDKAI